MIDNLKEIETKPYLVALNELECPDPSELESSRAELRDIKRTAETLKLWKFNFSLPIVCLGEGNNKYQLLTGFPLYQASFNAGLKRLWVFLIAVQRSEAEELIEEILLQSKLNREVVLITDEDITSFLDFANDKNSSLTQVSGIGKVFEARIIEKRPFTKEKLQEVFGAKKTLSWVKSFKKIPKD